MFFYDLDCATVEAKPITSGLAKWLADFYGLKK
jgi:hypothetical protein